jgi:hypothetical protein
MSLVRNIEDIGKTVLNYSHIGKALHYLRNRNNKNAVFIWIPKNAGTSIYKTLKKHGCLKAKKTARVKYRFSQRGLVTFGHMDYAQLVQKGYVSREFNQTAYKFCFSRNPYDRAISLYEYFKDGFPKGTTFHEFIQRVTEKGVRRIGLFNSIALSSCNPQVRWIENVNIDFYGSYENLGEDFNTVLRALELPEMSLLHLNKSRRSDYNEYYDLETKKRVEAFYKEDFEFFNYPMMEDSIINQ